MTAYAGGPQIQSYLDDESPDYGAILLSGAESKSALEQALMKLNSEVQGTETIFDARVKAAKMGAADASRIAGAETFAAGAMGLGKAASGFIGAIGSMPKTTEFSQPVKGFPGARETIGGYGGNEFFTPSEISGFDTSPITISPRDMSKYPLR